MAQSVSEQWERVKGIWRDLVVDAIELGIQAVEHRREMRMMDRMKAADAAHRERMTQAFKEIRAEREKAGVCPDCGQKHEDGDHAVAKVTN